MSYTHKFDNRVENNFSGYEQLLTLYSKTKDSTFSDIYIDLSTCDWFEANLSAVLGAIITKLQDAINSVSISSLHPGVQSILSKNSFLSNFGGELTSDVFETTISYKKFGEYDQKIFAKYILDELFSIPNLPKISHPLKKKIEECMLEIFINAQAHGDTRNIFTCGQFYPTKGKVDFSIINLGSAIQKNVSQYKQSSISSIDAIKWAVKEGNTTRKGPIPGGMGLSTLLSFIKLNRGKVQIISGNGYWENSVGYVEALFANYFDGTIVNIEFNVNDDNSYVLSSERSQESFF